MLILKNRGNKQPANISLEFMVLNKTIYWEETIGNLDLNYQVREYENK